jgi:hypothetical protein
MANPTYTLIGTPQVVGSGGAASVTFSSIPQTYTDLKIVLSARSNYANSPEGAFLTINGSTVFSNKNVFGTGAGTASQGQVGGDAGPFAAGNNWTANNFSNTEIYIPNYTSSNYKPIGTESVLENNGSGAYEEINAILWSNTSAITSIALSVVNGTLWLQNSTFWLYGIKNS